MPKNNEDRIQRVFDFIVDYKTKNDGLSPSFREIGRAVLGQENVGAVLSRYLEILQERKKIDILHKDGKGVRGIMLVGGRYVYPENKEDD